MSTVEKQENVALVKYDAMCRAIAEAVAVDEVKDVRDKATAIEVYARQSNNFDAERQAQQIRVRAERRCGELLKEQPKNTGTAGKGRPSLGAPEKVVPKTAPRTLADMGITANQSSQWQQLADVPQETFEEVLADTSEPITAHRVINTHRVKQEAAGIAPQPQPQPQPKPVNKNSIYLWGELRDTVATLKKIDVDEALREAPQNLFDGIVEYARELYDLLNVIGDSYERAQRDRQQN